MISPFAFFSNIPFNEDITPDIEYSHDAWLTRQLNALENKKSESYSCFKVKITRKCNAGTILTLWYAYQRSLRNCRSKNEVNKLESIFVAILKQCKPDYYAGLVIQQLLLNM